MVAQRVAGSGVRRAMVLCVRMMSGRSGRHASTTDPELDELRRGVAQLRAGGPHDSRQSQDETDGGHETPADSARPRHVCTRHDRRRVWKHGLVSLDRCRTQGWRCRACLHAPAADFRGCKPILFYFSMGPR